LTISSESELLFRAAAASVKILAPASLATSVVKVDAII